MVCNSHTMKIDTTTVSTQAMTTTAIDILWGRLLIFAGRRTWIRKLVLIFLPFQRKQKIQQELLWCHVLLICWYLPQNYHWRLSLSLGSTEFTSAFLCGGMMSWNFLILPLVSPMLCILPFIFSLDFLNQDSTLTYLSTWRGYLLVFIAKVLSPYP